MLALILLVSAIPMGLAEVAATPEALLAGMTIEQKVAQLLMPAFRYYTDENGEKQPVIEMRDDIRAMLQKYGFAGVIFFLQNAQDTAQAVKLVDAMHQATAGGGFTDETLYARGSGHFNGGRGMIAIKSPILHRKSMKGARKQELMNKRLPGGTDGSPKADSRLYEGGRPHDSRR